MSIRIRRQYFNDIVDGTKTKELRADSPYWRGLFGDGRGQEYIGGTITFVCGDDVHARSITGIDWGRPERFLGREPSEQGKKDILPEKRLSDFCWAIYLGFSVER